MLHLSDSTNYRNLCFLRNACHAQERWVMLQRTDAVLLPPVRNNSLFLIPGFSSSAGQYPRTGWEHPGFVWEQTGNLGIRVYSKLSCTGMEEHQKPWKDEKYFQGNTEGWPFSWWFVFIRSQAAILHLADTEQAAPSQVHRLMKHWTRWRKYFFKNGLLEL